MIRYSLITAATMLLATAASAQSSVTIYGIVDVAAKSIHNGSAGTVKSLGPSGMQAGQLGFRGIEDLGDGLTAGFVLESDLNADNGTVNSTKLFNRGAYVRLSSNKWGEIRLGHDYTPTYRNDGIFDPFNNLGVGAQTNVISLLGSNTGGVFVRDDNMVSYYTPDRFGGYYANVSVAAGEGVANTKYSGGRAGYDGSQLRVSVAYGAVSTSSGLDYKLKNLAGSYDFKVAKVNFIFNRAEYGAASQNAYMLGFLVPIDTWIIRGSYNDARTRGGSGAFSNGTNSKQLAFGGIYYLSKRTALYATASRIDNSGQANSVVGTPPSAAAMRAGEKSSGLDFGLMHKF